LKSRPFREGTFISVIQPGYYRIVGFIDILFIADSFPLDVIMNSAIEFFRSVFTEAGYK